MTGLSAAMKIWLSVVIVAAAMLSGPGEAAEQAEDVPEAQQLNEQVLDLYSQGQYDQALPLAQRVLALREAGLGPEHLLVCASLTNLAILYRDKGRYELALPLFQRSLAIAESARGPEHPFTGGRLNDLAVLHRDTGRYELALPLLQRALVIAEKAEGPERPATAIGLNNLALVYRDMGRFEEALPLFQRASEIAEKALGPEHPTTATSLNNLARLHQEMGRYEQALPLYQRALAITENTLNPEHPSIGLHLSNLALLYEAMGRYEQALPLFQRSLAIADRTSGPEHPMTGTVLNNLGALYRNMGRYEQALPLLQRALAIAEKTLGPEHPSTAIGLNNLAQIYQDMGRYEQVLPLYQRALNIFERAKGYEHPSTGTSLGNIASLYRAMGRYEEALPLYERALAIAEKAEGAAHPSTGARLNNFAKLYQAMGRYEQALPLLQRALTIADSSGSPELSWTVQGNLMELHRLSSPSAPELHQPALAIWYGKQAVNSLQTLRGQMRGLDRELQDSFLGKNKGSYQTLANLLIESGRIAEAEQVLAMLKERELFELTRSSGAEPSRRQADFVGPERQALSEYRRLASLAVKDATELAALEKRISAGDSLSEAEQLRRQSLLKAAESWRAEYQKFLSGLGQFFAEAARRPTTREADSQATRLQAQVAQDRNGAVGLHYVVAEDRVGIIVATAQSSFGRFSDIKRKDLTNQIVALRQALLARADTRPAAQALWKMLIEPVQADLQAAGAKTLVLSLTDELRYLPFAALQNPAGRYLIEDHALALWAAAADAKAATSSTPWRVSALGLTQARPGFSALPAVRQELSGIVRTQDAGSDRSGRSGALPGSIALDEQFSRDAFQTALAGRNNVVHVASHFDFRPGDESRSVLLMGQGEPLSLGQLAVMNFQRVEQLTLSACDTATGGGINENGAEVEGLAAVVLRQRAQAVLATLWKVADASTAQLMHDFYAAHSAKQPLGRAQALRQAQLDMLRGGATNPTLTVEQRRSWAHPFYWAPFVLSGNWL